MDTEKCRIYLTALESGSLSAAAEKMGFTPSGISRSIASLEEEYGFKLFYRERSGLKATEEAKVLLPTLRELVYQAEKLSELTEELRGGERGTLTIGVSYASYFRMISEKVKEFRRSYPGIEIKTLQGTSTELTAALREHRADLIIATEREGNFRFIPLKKDPMLAVLPAQHALSGAKVYPLCRFAEDPVIAAYPDKETDYGRELKKAGVRPNIQFTTTDIYAAYCMVEAGLGVALLNSLEVREWAGEVVLLPTDPAIVLQIGIMVRMGEELAPSARKFLKILQED